MNQANGGIMKSKEPIGYGGNMRLIQKIKALLPKKDPIPWYLGDPSLRNVSPEVLEELAEMVDKRRAELLDNQIS